jgi:hypothetical protein
MTTTNGTCRICGNDREVYNNPKYSSFGTCPTCDRRLHGLDPEPSMDTAYVNCIQPREDDRASYWEALLR